MDKVWTKQSFFSASNTILSISDGNGLTNITQNTPIHTISRIPIHVPVEKEEEKEIPPNCTRNDEEKSVNEQNTRFQITFEEISRNYSFRFEDFLCAR